MIALDLLGHGWSSRSPSLVPYSQLEHVTFVQMAVEAMGLTKFHLCGHSMGGGIASLFAATFPEMVTRVAILESYGVSLIVRVMKTVHILWHSNVNVNR